MISKYYSDKQMEELFAKWLDEHFYVNFPDKPYKTTRISDSNLQKEGIDINSLNWNLTEEGKRYCFADYQNEKILVLDVYGEFANNTILNVAYVIGNIADKPTYYYASNK